MRSALFAFGLFAASIASACTTPSPKTPASAEVPLKELPYAPSLDLSSMDKSVDPCDDLYHYACGGWLKANPIPPDQSSWSVYGKLARTNERVLWGLLVELAKGGAERTPPQQKIGDYFAACMDEDAAEKKGAAPLKADLDAIAALKDKAALAELLGKLQPSLDAGVFFGLRGDQDYQDATQYIPILDAGGLGLPDRDQYVKDDAASKELREKYRAHVARTFQLLGETADVAGAHAATVLRIETELAKATLTSTDKRDPYKIHHKMDAASLQALTPGFTWARYFAAAGVGAVQKVDVSEPDFLKALDARLAAEPLPDLQAYLRWHVARVRSPYLDHKFVEEDFDFYRRSLRGVKEMPPRWRRCVQYVGRDLGEALGQVYVEKSFSPAVKEATLDMVARIQWAMEIRVRGLDWMSEPTKARAVEKLHGMRNKVGYPDKWRDYSAYSVARDDLAGNVARGSVFEMRRELDRVGKPLDRGEWLMNANEVNAYYNPQMNDMNFPAGVLQPPLMDLHLDAAPSYGDTGGTIGHELTHGFDDEGRQYDAKGNLKDWWTDKDAKAFVERAQCIVDQYAQVTIVDDIKLNSKLSLGEDVADLGGEILAFEAWKNATAKEKLEPKDGLTPEQRFFVGFAQWACGDTTPEAKRVSALNNPHSPPEARINGVVVNIPDYARAFACKPGARMRKEKVCKVW